MAFIKIDITDKSIVRELNNSYVLAMPQGSAYEGYTFLIAYRYIKFSDPNHAVISLSDRFTFKLSRYTNGQKEEIEIGAYDLVNAFTNVNTDNQAVLSSYKENLTQNNNVTTQDYNYTNNYVQNSATNYQPQPPQLTSYNNNQTNYRQNYNNQQNSNFNTQSTNNYYANRNNNKKQYVNKKEQRRILVQSLLDENNIGIDKKTPCIACDKCHWRHDEKGITAFCRHKGDCVYGNGAYIVLKCIDFELDN